MDVSGETIQVYRGAYLSALLELSPQRAERVVDAALADGLSPVDLYVEVFQPALKRIGVLWERQHLTVAQEHVASGITQRLMSRLSPTFQPPALAHGRVVLLGCVADEWHQIGLQMVADLLRADGWEVLYLGQTVPSASLLDLAAHTRVEVLGLSVTLPAHLGAVHVLIGEARARGLRCKILVGGGALARAPEMAAALGADGTGADAREAVRVANALCLGQPI